jgi:predicted RNase H-like HicB family nuclease
MRIYHAAYYLDPESKWYTVEVVDFPGAVSQGRTLKSARVMIRDALKLLAQTLLDDGEPLPRPHATPKPKTADFFEKIPLSFRVQTPGAL